MKNGRQSMAGMGLDLLVLDFSPVTQETRGSEIVANRGYDHTTRSPAPTGFFCSNGSENTEA